MSENSQTNLENLGANDAKIFKVYLTILGHYALKC